MRRSILVPILLALLGVAAIGTTMVLQQRSNHSRSAQLRLSMLKTELAMLQSAPRQASAASGGSPAGAARLIRTGKARIAETLRVLGQRDPPQALQQLQAPLSANYAVLDRIYQIGVSPTGSNRESDRLAGVARRSQASTGELVDAAVGAYGRRAHRSAWEAIVGRVAAIVLLLSSVGFLYWQNRRLLESRQQLLDASRQEALSDALTGLRNRRALVSDLTAALVRASDEQPLLLALFDLDGFKQYNDTFGHPAGDTLLSRLGERLQASVQGSATAYRMGGDEFCLLATVAPHANGEIVRRAAAALTESADLFTITCSHGSALVPTEASSTEQALRLADQRMYAQKTSTASAGRQSSDVLLNVLNERNSSPQAHVSSVGQLARLIAERLQLPRHEQNRIQLAAELHDIGKTAIPDSLLHKPGKLSTEEWEYMRRHTLIGERILLAAPALAHTAALVRSSHEHLDGTGYPDGLTGDEIPIGSRIIAVCDAFDAMTTNCTYQAALPLTDALAQLHHHAGTHFDPHILEILHTLTHELARSERAA